MEEKIIESIGYLLPAIVTGLVAYYMFKGFIHQQSSEMGKNQRIHPGRVHALHRKENRMRS